MGSSPRQYVGIDVSQDWLDMFIHPLGQALHVGNDDEGIAELVETLRLHRIALVVCEATGGLEYRLARALDEAGLPTAVVNPAAPHAFRAAQGQRAKTDPLDARLLARFAERMRPVARPALDPEHKALRDLVVRRRQIVATLAGERHRLRRAHGELARQSLQRIIRSLEAERAVVEDQLLAAVTADPHLAPRYRRLLTIPSIGPVVALTLVTEMPELGSLNRKTVASLAGVAPHQRSSGKTNRRAVIGGGRKCARAALYMAAVTAARCNPLLAPVYQSLVNEGKPKKLALTAIMRRLAILANQILKENRDWSIEHA